MGYLIKMNKKNFVRLKKKYRICNKIVEDEKFKL